MKDDVVIVSATRTPVGAFNGAFASLPAHELGKVAIKAALGRAGVKMGNFEMIDTMIKDGLWDAFNGYHMGNTAENVARQWQITRQQQDAFAVASQNKAEAAQKSGRFKDEITPVTVKSRKGDIVVDADEYP